MIPDLTKFCPVLNFVRSPSTRFDSTMAKYLKRLCYLSEDDNFYCGVCQESFSDPSVHLKNHMRMTLFTCRKAKCLMTTEYNKAVMHMQETEGAHIFKYTCLKCNHTDTELKKYMDHLRKHRQAIERAKRCQVIGLSPVIPITHQAAYGVLSTCKLNNSEPPAREYDATPYIYAQPKTYLSYRCPVCDQGIASLDWQSHMQVHLTNTSIVCKNCKINFVEYKSNTEIKDPMADLNHRFVYYCHVCKIYHPTYLNYVRHLKFHEKNKRKDSDSSAIKKHYSCTFCGKIFFEKEIFRTHNLMHYSDAIFFCRVCFDNLGSNCKCALEHFESHQVPTMPAYGVSFLCLYCGENVNNVSQSSVADHLAQHWQGKKGTRKPSHQPMFRCKAVTGSLTGFPHCILHFEDGTETCDAQFTNVNSLFAHVREHTCIDRPSEPPKFKMLQDWASESIPKTNDEHPCPSAPLAGNNDTKTSKIKIVAVNSSDGPAQEHPCQSVHVGGNGISSYSVNTNVLRTLLGKRPASTPESSPKTIEVKLQPSASALTPSAVPNEQGKQLSTTQLPSKPRIKIFVCKACGKRFIEEHFFRQHLKKAH